MKKTKNTETKPDSTQVETKVQDPVVERLDKIIDLLVAIKSNVSSIETKVNSIQEKVPAPFDFSRLVKD